MRRELVLGGPGTGKTTHLINTVQERIAAGVRPERIAFVSFTRAAVNKARSDAMRQFGLAEDHLPWFRTLHSACYRMIGIEWQQVMTQRHRDELSELTGQSAEEKDLLMALSVRARMAMRDPYDEWKEFTETLAAPLPEDVTWFQLSRFMKSYKNYRTDQNVYDFTDMLEVYLASDCEPAPVDIAVVDEAQDLSRLQWRVVEKAFANCKEIFYAGDDDQAVYLFSGADKETFLNLDVDHRKVLEVSHRLPQPVFELAQSVVQRISRRYDKPTVSSGKAGRVEYHRRVAEIDFSSGSWLLLARTRHQLESFVWEARRQGVLYALQGELSVDLDTVQSIRAYERLRRGGTVDSADAQRVLKVMDVRGRKVDDGRDYTASELGIDAGPTWFDALTGIAVDQREYFRMVLRRGEKLDADVRVHIDTIHGSKGREADNVLLATDNTKRIADAFRRDEDPEHRVFYVGVTRASSVLHVLLPRNGRGYRL